MVTEQIVLLIAQENLDIACEAIEKAAMDRALGEIDEAFVQHLESRRRHRDVCFFVLIRFVTHEITATSWSTILGSAGASGLILSQSS